MGMDSISKDDTIGNKLGLSKCENQSTQKWRFQENTVLLKKKRINNLIDQ